MRARPLVMLGAFLAFAGPLDAQLRVQVGAGVLWSSLLVTDSIVEPIEVGPVAAPSLTVMMDGALDSTYRVGVSVAWASSMLRSTSRTDTTDIVALTVWEPTLRLSRAWSRFDVGLRAGLQVYRAARAVGIFRDGGTVTPALGVDVNLRGPRVAGGVLGIGAGWSVARFTTTALSISGFSGQQTVHRLGLRMTVSGGPGAR